MPCPLSFARLASKQVFASTSNLWKVGLLVRASRTVPYVHPSAPFVLCCPNRQQRSRRSLSRHRKSDGKASPVEFLSGNPRRRGRAARGGSPTLLTTGSSCPAWEAHALASLPLHPTSPRFLPTTIQQPQNAAGGSEPRSGWAAPRTRTAGSVFGSRLFPFAQAALPHAKELPA